MSDQNWRPEIDAEDYFSHQKKKLNVADRRPVIRKASDLVGPGIDGQAVRIDNFNDPLAQFNGYFSAVVASGMDVAMNAPAEGSFIGTVISDAELGGKQMFTSLGDGKEYVRTFIRNPTDTDFVFWGPWGLAGGGSGGPIGSITAFGGSAAPDGWLVCDGGAVSRTDYADLFAVIGTAYGPGNGSSTFNLPDARNRALYGAGSHWTLGGNDGLSEANRGKILSHDHGGITTIDGEHSHSLGAESNGAPAVVGGANNFSVYGHSHPVNSAGGHGHTFATWSEEYEGNPPRLRGVGVNYIIRYE